MLSFGYGAARGKSLHFTFVDFADKPEDQSPFKLQLELRVTNSMHCLSSRSYLIACGLIGLPVPPVMISGGPQKKNS